MAELEYMKLKFDPINDVLKLYADTAIQFGYMIMFSTALPTASVCTLINNIVKLPLQVFINSLTSVLTTIDLHAYLLIRVVQADIEVISTPYSCRSARHRHVVSSVQPHRPHRDSNECGHHCIHDELLRFVLG